MVAKSTGRGPAVDPTFMAANNAFLALKDLEKEDLAVATAMLSQRLGVPIGAGAMGQRTGGAGTGNGQGGRAVVDTSSAKEFVRSKPTLKEIERVAVYGYYLAHHQDKPEFNGRDLDAFRKDVRGPAFSNIKVHIDNATKAGHLTSVGGGNKGITARGEALVNALPDREAVKAALEAQPTRRRFRRTARGAKGGG